MADGRGVRVEGGARRRRIAIVGAGAIGSAFAFQLAKGGHAVTVVARGLRLKQLERDDAVVLVTGERAAVEVRGALDPAVPFDLVLVTVLAPQVDAVLPALGASAATTIMFMFNTFEPLDRLRDAVGEARFAFGFPAGVFAHLVDGKLKHQLFGGTTVTHQAWARAFGDAGIRTVTTDDMHSWLRSHAASVVPLMAIGHIVVARGAGVTWGEAAAHARAMASGFRLVRTLGNSIAPSSAVALSRSPTLLVTTLFWILSRTRILRDLGALGPTEARMLIDQMSAVAPGQTEALLAIAP